MAELKLIITGTPGTGKTLLAKYISKSLDVPLYDVTTLIKKENSLDKTYNSELDTLEVNEEDLKKFLNTFFKDKQTFILEGHMSHLLSKDSVDLCIVLRTENSTLSKRLVSRRYSQQKIRDNLEAEIFNYCYEEAKLNNHKILTIDTTNFDNREYTLLIEFLKKSGLIK